jgi:regulatory protein
LSSFPPENAAELKARALRHLARREHSRAELERKLAPHAESAGALQALLDQLEQKKQLSNERFAEQRAHVLARKFGPAHIRHDLKAKGVAEHLIERVSAASEARGARPAGALSPGPRLLRGSRASPRPEGPRGLTGMEQRR